MGLTEIKYRTEWGIIHIGTPLNDQSLYQQGEQGKMRLLAIKPLKETLD